MQRPQTADRRWGGFRRACEAAFRFVHREARAGPSGKLSPGQMVKEFDQVVFSAPRVGVVQGPVKTQFGYHLVEVTLRTD